MKKTALLFIFFITLFALKAQQVIPVIGGNGSGSGGSFSYSVGQIACKTISNTNGSISEGVQQANKNGIPTKIDDTKDIVFAVSVFPNPTTDKVILTVKNPVATDLDYKLVDLSGKILQSEKIKSLITEISLKDYISSFYFIKIVNKEKEVRTIKIIKK